MRPASRASLKSYEKIVGVEPETSDSAGDLNVELGMMCTDETSRS